MIDTHCHIDTTAFDEDRNEVINRATRSGVEYIIVPAIEPKTFDSLINIVENYDNLFFAIGVHPHNATEVSEEILNRIYDLSLHNKAVAIGEIGLDYYYDFSPKSLQIETFRKQILIAKKQNLPIIVHNRDSSNDLLNILEKEQDGNLKGVLHCFSGDLDMMRRSIDLGFHISFTGNITFKKTNLTKIVEETPMNRILLETDSPWMTPPPNRGKRNEPANIRIIVEKIANIKSISFNEVLQMTNDNAKKLFRLMVALLFFLFSFSISSAQTTTTVYDDDYEVYYDDSDEDNWLYPKFIGFGPVVGVNTIVETYQDGVDISYEGLFAAGATINYQMLEYLMLTGSFTYSKNSQYVKNYNVDPNIHQSIEISSLWSPNPNRRVNFFGIVGLSYMTNKYSRREFTDEFPDGKKYYETENDLGINTGLGFNVNIDFGNAGILGIMAEWKLNFMMGTTKLDFDPRQNPLLKDGSRNDLHYKTSEISTFFSIPRLSVVWYPKF